MVEKSDLLKRMRATLVLGVISRGSSDHEYSVAASQFKEAITEIERLRGQWNDISAVETQAEKLLKEAWGHGEGR